MKITKSELKGMIREALGEELRLRESSIESNTITDALDKALRASERAAKRGIGSTPNVLISTQPGRGVITTCHSWAQNNNIDIRIVDCTKIDDIPSFMSDTLRYGKGHVLVLDNYDRATPKVRAGLLTVINENSCGQLFTVAIAVGRNDSNELQVGYPINSAERSQFEISVRA